MSFHFVLKRSGWGYKDLYEALKTGEKTSEWRDGSDHWKSRLLNYEGRRDLQTFIETYPKNGYPHLDFPPFEWKYNKARFVVGYTKSPMLLADVKTILYLPDTDQFEVQIMNVVEVN